MAQVIQQSKPEETIPEILNKAFLTVDNQVNEHEGKFSGCTAIVAFVKVTENNKVKRTMIFN